MKILVVDDERCEAPMVEAMFKDQGFELVTDIYDADFLCFVGGEDVNPSLYGQRLHATTHYNISRDNFEEEVFNNALSLGIPMVGICRGGQFLNVKSGGKLWQNVDNHNSGQHKALVPSTNEQIMVTSVHHQMMEPDWYSNVEILLRAGESTRKEAMSELTSYMPHAYSQFPGKGSMLDVEACYYPDTRSLCFQPHPEYGHEPTMDIFFEFLKTYIIDKIGEENAA